MRPNILIVFVLCAAFALPSLLANAETPAAVPYSENWENGVEDWTIYSWPPAPTGVDCTIGHPGCSLLVNTNGQAEHAFDTPVPAGALTVSFAYLFAPVTQDSNILAFTFATAAGTPASAVMGLQGGYEYFVYGPYDVLWDVGEGHPALQANAWYMITLTFTSTGWSAEVADASNHLVDSAGPMPYDYGVLLPGTGLPITRFTDVEFDAQGIPMHIDTIRVTATGAASPISSIPSLDPSRVALIAQPDAGGRAVDLAWSATGSYTSYSVCRGNGTALPTICVNVGTATAYVDSGLTPGAYTYNVVATASDGSMATSNSVTTAAIYRNSDHLPQSSVDGVAACEQEIQDFQISPICEFSTGGDATIYTGPEGTYFANGTAIGTSSTPILPNLDYSTSNSGDCIGIETTRQNGGTMGVAYLCPS